ncbi:MAG: dihydrofolate reductase [Eubacteriales bacterium]|nr:dihydrofolate reductase [Eubacteriales bacterium]
MHLIAAVDKNWGIGKDGRLLFRLSGDLSRFRTLTMGHIVILGHSTLSTFPGGKPLSRRENIVLSRDLTLSVPGAIVCHSIPDLFYLLSDSKNATKECFVIGGANVYAQLIPYCSDAYITHVAADAQADRFLPNIARMESWSLADLGDALEENGVSFSFARYENRAPLLFN